MPSLGDVYVDVHANTKDLKPEVRKAAAAAGDDGGRQFSKGFEKQTKRAMGRFEKEFQSSIGKALDNLPDIELNADSSDAQREIQAIKGELRALGDQEIGVDIDAAGALARLGMIRVALAALSKDKDIDIGFGAGGALGAITSLTNILPQFSGTVAEAGGVSARLGISIGSLGATASAAAPLLIAFGTAIALLVGVAGAAAGALGGLALALAAPLGAAAGGGGLFALLAGKYISETNKVLDQIKQLKKDSKFGEANALIAKLSTAQTAYMKAREGLSAAYKKFLGDNDAALLGPFTQGIGILTRLMPKLSPLIQAVSDSFSRLLTQLDNSGALDAMIGSMTSLVQGGIIDKVGSALGSLGSIFGSIFGAGKDLGVKAIDGMSNALSRLDGYLKSDEGRKQLNEFFTWVETHGPGIWQSFLDIGEGVKDFIKAMTPAGEAFLVFMGAFGKFSSIMAPVFKVAMAVIIGLFAGFTAIVAGAVLAVGYFIKGIGSIPGAPAGVKENGEAIIGVGKAAWKSSQEMAELVLQTDKASKQKVNIPVAAKTQQAKDDAAAAVKAIEALKPMLTISADDEPAETEANTYYSKWHNKELTLKIGATISGAAQKVMDFVSNFGWLPGMRGATGGRIPAGFASGGKVPGTTPRNRAIDNVAALTRRGNPLRVQSGEWIINSRASQQNDRLLAAINGGFNAQKALGFNMGGLVPAGRRMSTSSAGASINNSDNRNIEINLNEYGPRSGSTKVQDLNWWLNYGTRTRFSVATP